MKKLLTLILILTAGFTQAQITVFTLDTRLNTLEKTAIDTAMYNLQIAKQIDNSKVWIQGWVNATRRQTDDTINARLGRLRNDITLQFMNLQSNLSAQIQVISDQLTAVQNKPDSTALLQGQIEALKLRIDNLKATTIIQ